MMFLAILYKNGLNYENTKYSKIITFKPTTMFLETLVQNNPFRGQAIDPITHKVVPIHDFIGQFDVLEELADGAIKRWQQIDVKRQNNLVRSFQRSDNNTKQPLLVAEYGEKECGIGASCWLSSIAMMSWLSDNHKQLGINENTSVLEVGCGVALSSLYLTSLGYDNVTASDNKHTIGCVYEENKLLNNILKSANKFQYLDWEHCCQDGYDPKQTIGTFDIIIASDCVYKSTSPMLIEAIRHHLAKNGKLIMINPMETSRHGINDTIYKLAELGDTEVSHIAIQLNNLYTKPLMFVVVSRSQ
jgi:SAM-dependent methyltransferase